MEQDILSIIRAAVSQASTEVTDERPLSKATLADLEAGAGVPSWRDRTPEESRKRKERKLNNDRLSSARRRERQERIDAATKERQARMRDPQRLAEVYSKVMANIDHLVRDVARMKANQMSRHLGGYELEDIQSDTVERVARKFASYNMEVADMHKVAKEWRHNRTLPTNLDGLEQVMAQTINIQAKKAVSQWWRDNPTLDSIEKLTTMDYNSSGADAVINRSIADGDLTIVGWRPTGPGKVDPALVQHILNGIIKERKLDAVADFILGMDEDEDGELHYRMKTDGTFPWYRYSKTLWEAMGLDPQVYRAIPKNKRAKAVETAVRNRFTIVQNILERAYYLLSEHQTDLNMMRKHVLVEVVSQEPTCDLTDLLDALRELT